ncbi:MAG: hypothetical protein IJ523_10455 [Succinivibrionaceae bacterium]|nr:hypothetical protein [Succinivibrionaceae bacterium]
MLKTGDKVFVTRANGETVQGVVKRGPLDYLKHIGEFYIIRNPVGVFIGRKDVTPEIGMYEREQIERKDDICAGRRS